MHCIWCAQGVESSELESQQYGSDTSGANNAAGGTVPHRRKRTADYYAGGYDVGGYAGPDEQLPVPKRVRTTGRESAAVRRPGASAAEASPSPRQAPTPNTIAVIHLHGA